MTEIEYHIAQRQASGAANGRSDGGAEAIGGRLQALVGQGRAPCHAVEPACLPFPPRLPGRLTSAERAWCSYELGVYRLCISTLG
jgi:hypothetical protein